MKTSPGHDGSARFARALRRAALACALALGLAHAPASAQEGAAAPVRRPPSVNTTPLFDFARVVREMSDAGQLGPEVTFEWTVTAPLKDDGTLDGELLTESRLRMPADPNAMRLLRELADALSRSRVLSVLGGAKPVTLRVRLDGRDFAASAEAEAASEAEAARNAEGYTILLTAARLSRKGTAEGPIYDAVRFTSEGKLFRVGLRATRADALRTIREVLAKRAPAGPANR